MPLAGIAFIFKQQILLRQSRCRGFVVTCAFLKGFSISGALKGSEIVDALSGSWTCDALSGSWTCDALKGSWTCGVTCCGTSETAVWKGCARLAACHGLCYGTESVSAYIVRVIRRWSCAVSASLIV